MGGGLTRWVVRMGGWCEWVGGANGWVVRMGGWGSVVAGWVDV